MARKALVVGINNYPEPHKLNGCVNDATHISRLLKKHEDGSPNFSTQVYNEIGAIDLSDKINELFEGNNEVALFYFSGHGFIWNDKTYIVTSDYSPSKHIYGVSLDEILDIANKSQANNKIIILDSCHSGGMGTPRMFNNTAAMLGGGLTILTSSLNSEASVEINGHGVFTSLLLEGLRGGAADILGHITLGSLYAYVDKALGPWEQRPVFKTNISSFLSIRNVQPSVPTSYIRKLCTYFKECDTEIQLNPSYEYTNTPESEHKVIEPYATEEHVKEFKVLQKLESIGLVQPVGEEHMYFAAMNSKSCKLTPVGQHFWHLVKKEKI